MRFSVHQSHRLEELLDALAERVRRDPLPPLESETILVPAPGLARWVQLRLAERFGIVAGVQLPFFGAFLQDLCRRAAAVGDDPFARDALAWRIWRLLGEGMLRSELGPAFDYCRDDDDGSKRYQLAARLATCFDDYQLWRPDLLLAFARGDDGKALGPHGKWQSNLWRALLHDAGVNVPAMARPRGKRSSQPPPQSETLFHDEGAEPPPRHGSAHRLACLVEMLGDPARARAVLPPRLSVFGAGALPPALLAVLQRMAAHVPVDLYVPLPTPHFIGDLRERGDHGGANPLLARLGTEAREFADALARLEDEPGLGLPALSREGDAVAGSTGTEPSTLLQCVQEDIVNAQDRGARGGPPRFPLGADDDSLRVHDCHSPQRELEVVRDQILAAFDADRSLRPHDVLVLVPDIDRYAPYAHAVFGPVAEHLPFHVADRSPARELPICKALLEVLALARSRLPLFDVLHLLEEPAVRRRFGLFPTDLAALRSICHRAGIRWGLDGASRESVHGIPAFDENSWRQGLDRIVLGTATGPSDDLFAGVLPVADATESRLPLLLRFVTFTNELFARMAPLRERHSLLEWAQLLEATLAALFAPEGPDDATAVAQLRNATANLRRLAAVARHTDAVGPVVLTDWLTDALRRTGGSRGYLAGAVTIAAMLPMRTVPARHLFVCGLDDASFPRRDSPVPFDLIAAEHRAGDRSRRLDDRQMFLDVLLAARERLHLCFVGHSAKDDAPCAPSVVLAELLEHLDRSCVSTDAARPVRDLVVVRQPLQPWSRRYRTDDDPRLFTFALRRPSAMSAAVPETAWCDGVVAATADEGPIPVSRLLDFWWHPCRWFLRQTMQLRLPRDEDRDDEDEPFALHGLDKYRIQNEALRRAQRGETPLGNAFAHARASGILPVGEHGRFAFAELEHVTNRFVAKAMRYHADGARSISIAGPDFTITGELEGVGRDELVLVRPALVKPKDKVRGWLLHVLAAVARHQGARDLPARTRLLGTDETRLAEPLALDDAMAMLELAVAGYRRGQAAPLPFFENCSFAYGLARSEGADHDTAFDKAKKKWDPPDDDAPRSAFDGPDPNIALCMRGRDALGAPDFATWATAIWNAVERCLLVQPEDE